ncbi:hypothetical protein VE00_09684 [Pseudogymnoascus sp. WSF 3629]|nr:hypothetical protein VE00_09684 [Pseudogymnoascus sp. WSF 3629]
MRPKLVGRERELDSASRAIESFQDHGKTSIALSGIGGIGKTATMLNIAHQELDRRNIFYVQGNDKASLDHAYPQIARSIGPEYLMKEFQGKDLQEAWRNASLEEKIERFKAWLEDAENKKSLFLFDDVDGVQ